MPLSGNDTSRGDSYLIVTDSTAATEPAQSASITELDKVSILFFPHALHSVPKPWNFNETMAL